MGATAAAVAAIAILMAIVVGKERKRLDYS